MDKYNLLGRLARSLEKRLDPTFSREFIYVALQLIAAVRCFLARRGLAPRL